MIIISGNYLKGISRNTTNLAKIPQKGRLIEVNISDSKHKRTFAKSLYNLKILNFPIRNKINRYQFYGFKT